MRAAEKVVLESSSCPLRMKPKHMKRDHELKLRIVCQGEVLHLPGALSKRDLASLEAYLQSEQVQSTLEEAVLHDSVNAQYKSRRCDSAWVALRAIPAARKLKGIVKKAQNIWELLPRTKQGFLRCNYEDVQYTEYRGESNAHFQQWHLDADNDGQDEEDKRELTIVVLLTEPGVDFEGGDFECMTPTYPSGIHHTVVWRKGDAIAFRSKALWHRVLPTTSGIRKTLVLWAKRPDHR